MISGKCSKGFLNDASHSLAIFGITSVPNSSSERSAPASDMVPRKR